MWTFGWRCFAGIGLHTLTLSNATSIAALDATAVA